MQNRYKLWIVLALVGAFGAGLLGGIFSERYYFHSQRRDRPAVGQRGGPHFPSLEEMARELELSAEQQGKIKAIFEENDARLKDLRTEMHSRLGTIRSALKDKIDVVLTPEQKAKLEAKIEKYLKQRKEANEKRRPDSDRERPQDKPTGEMK
jgi:Spy/CpxP family protein refolding chaperone